MSSTPLVGIMCNKRPHEMDWLQIVNHTYLESLARYMQVQPVLIPAPLSAEDGFDGVALLDRLELKSSPRTACPATRLLRTRTTRETRGTLTALAVDLYLPLTAHLRSEVRPLRRHHTLPPMEVQAATHQVLLAQPHPPTTATTGAMVVEAMEQAVVVDLSTVAT